MKITRMLRHLLGSMVLFIGSIASATAASPLSRFEVGLRFLQPTNHPEFSNPVIYDIVQTQEGFIWLATADGLNRFDGQQNVIYRPDKKSPHSISHFTINKLLVDKQGTLWVGTNDGLDRYDPALDTFSRFTLFDENQRNPNNSAIRRLFEDSRQQLWVATTPGEVKLISPQRNTVEQVKFGRKISHHKSLYINDFIETEQQKILVATSIGLLQFNPQTRLLNPITTPSHSQTDEVKHHSLTTNVKYLLPVDKEKLLIGTLKGLYQLNQKTGQYTAVLPQTFANVTVVTMSRYDQNNILIGTRKSGLFLLNLLEHSVKGFKNQPTEPQSLIDNQINALFTDRDGLFWLGTNLGVNLLDPRQRRFGHIKANEMIKECLSGNTIYAILPDSKHFLWVGVFGHGLHQINLISGQCVKFTGLSQFSSGNQLKQVVSLYEDHNADVWIGTYRKGMFRYRRDSNSVEHFDTKAYLADSLPPLNITAIIGDGRSKIWFSSLYGGFFEFDSNNNRLANFLPALTATPDTVIKSISDIELDHKGNLWLATKSQGLWRFETNSQKYRQFISSKAQPNGIPPALYAVKRDHNNQLWIGSQGQGAMRLSGNGDIQKRYSTDNGLLNNVVMNIEQDTQGNMWFLTDKGLSRLTQSDDTMQTFLAKQGMQADAFTSASYFEPQSRRLFTGGINGFNQFRPEDIIRQKRHYTPVLTEFELFYKSVLPSSLGTKPNKSPLDKVISQTQSMVLNYDQNVFSLGFTAMEFISPKQIHYQFRLDGYDTHWNTVNWARRYAHYTSIEPGDYTFRVRAANKHEQWSEHERTIAVTVLYPWWQTNLAYVVYFLLLITTVWGFVTVRTKALLKRADKLEKSVILRTQQLSDEKHKVEQLLSHKNEEFANISHEFRTPLTLILGPTAQLLKTSNKQDSGRLNIIQRNSYRLARMVDQLLNMETFRVKSITHKTTQASAQTIRLITEAFADLATEKNIELSVGQLARVNFEFTPDALEKIVVNLLSNAIKYTKTGGTINITSGRTLANELKITVQDSGIGIAADKLSGIFERFNRVLDDNSEQVTGAGIGLALVSNLVEYHQGRIEVESELEKGTIMTVVLPIINETSIDLPGSKNNDEIIAMELMSISAQFAEPLPTTVVTSDETSSKQPTVLVIEDNQDMRDYIVASIVDDYQVITASNGEIGVEMATSEVPDIIISDVMMPKKDGYQVTHEIRSHVVTNHIPIILLTARGDRDSRLKGWHQKADEYLTKPFDVEELRVRLNNLLEIRNILKRRFGEVAFQTQPSLLSRQDDESKQTYRQTGKTDKSASNQLAVAHEKFIAQVNAGLEARYAVPTTTVANIASDVAMSERQFFRKLKSIVDMTPVEYLRRFRLEKAKLLLSEHNVGYVTFEVGFSSQSYFGKCFKAQFGLSPGDFKKNQ